MKQLGRCLLIIFFLLGYPFLAFHFATEGNYKYGFDLYYSSMLFGIISYLYLLYVLVLSLRLRILDKIFGHDKLIRFHGILAMFSLTLVMVHLTLKVIMSLEFSLQKFVGLISLMLFIIGGLVALLCMSSMLSAFFKRNIQICKLDYNVSKKIHLLTLIAILAMIIHIFISSTFNNLENLLSNILIIIPTVLAFFMCIYFIIIKLFVNSINKLEITQVTELHKLIYRVSLKSSTSKPIKVKPGQFGFFKFLNKTTGSEEHPFTISESSGDTLTITVKKSGDFTSKIDKLEVGNKVIFDGPYGIFNCGNSQKNLIFIAGGIGITPFISLVKSLVKSKSNAVLLYAVSESEQQVYKQFFENEAKENDNFQFIPIVGFIKESDIQNALNLNKAEEAYLCGPPVMRDLAINHLLKFGIKKKNIFYENFSL